MNSTLTLLFFKMAALEQSPFRLVLCGQGEAGKSSILACVFDKMFLADYYPTLGTHIRRESLCGAKLTIRDTSGACSYSDTVEPLHHQTDAIVLVVDSQHPDMLVHLRKWVKSIRSVCSARLFIMLSKVDHRHKHTDLLAAALGEIYQVPIFPVSVIGEKTVRESFSAIVTALKESLAEEDSIGRSKVQCLSRGSV